MCTFVPFASDDEVLEIGRGLIDRTLPKPAWTHAAHFAAALWLLTHYGEGFVVRALPGFIRAYNEATGVANTETSGYHETITQASIRAADAFLAASFRRPSVCHLQRIDGLPTRRTGVAACLLVAPTFVLGRGSPFLA